VSNRWDRIAALTGVLFVVLVVAAFMVGGNSPANDAKASTIRSFYLTHKTRTNVSGLLVILAVIAGIFFYGYLRAYLRRSPAVEWLAALGFGGALVFGAGAAIAAGTSTALADVPGRLTPGALQALNVLNSDLSWPLVCVGLGTLWFGVGFAILKSRALPVWLGWVSLLLGATSASFVLSWIGFLGTGVWVLIVSILLAVRNPRVGAELAAQPPEAAVPTAPEVPVPVPAGV